MLIIFRNVNTPRLEMLDKKMLQCNNSLFRSKQILRR